MVVTVVVVDFAVIATEVPRVIIVGRRRPKPKKPLSTPLERLHLRSCLKIVNCHLSQKT